VTVRVESVAIISSADRLHLSFDLHGGEHESSDWALVVAVVVMLSVISAYAQTGDGSVRGYIKDQQGVVLPGVTVTASSSTLLAPVVAVTDASGYYRLLNLPPGTYFLTAELPGFSTHRREGIVMRAGLTLTVDIALAIGNLAETITVSGESPMIKTTRRTSVINIEGEPLRAAPITSRRLFSDALDMAPGIGSRDVDDGVGRRAYYFRGSHIYAHAFQLEGAPASAYIDLAAHSMGMGGDTVQDVEIKLGGADASTPLSTGVVMNVVTPRGQNEFKCRRRSRSTSWTSRSAAASCATRSGSTPRIAMPTWRTASAARRPTSPI
jgi:hypothetical protein